MPKVHIALQVLWAVAVMLYIVVFQLSGKVIALPLGNIAVKAYLSNEGGKASPFLSRLGCCILKLANMHVITFIPTYIHIHLKVETEYLSWRLLVPE